ncbi:MAG: biopolymer transporter ExbD [Fulvivirga sp.]|nr:biopolymer transporter ExbD [Fulvivirga sp.]
MMVFSCDYLSLVAYELKSTMNKFRKHKTSDINTASMADIAFLLLIFFMVTTTITQDKGLDLLLPPHLSEPPKAEIHERNLFKILINSEDQLLVEGEPRASYTKLQDEIKAFILNYGKDDSMSDHPGEAVVSIKTNRGTSQGLFIKVLDEAKAAYYTIYAEKLGLSTEEVRNLDQNNLVSKSKYRQLKRTFPMNISIAEPR